MSTRAERHRTARRPSGKGGGKSFKSRGVAAILTIAFAVGIAVIAFVERRSVPSSATEAPIYGALTKGDPAPRFRVTTLTGDRVDSSQISRPIMLEIFATWCPHCQRETRTIEQLRQRFGDRLSIVAVTGSDTASDRQSAETAGDVRAFAQHFGIDYPVAYDPGLAVAKRYLQGGFPTIIFVDRSKRISSIESGEIDLARLSAEAHRAGAAGGR